MEISFREVCQRPCSHAAWVQGSQTVKTGDNITYTDLSRSWTSRMPHFPPGTDLMLLYKGVADWPNWGICHVYIQWVRQTSKAMSEDLSHLLLPVMATEGCQMVEFPWTGGAAGWEEEKVFFILIGLFKEVHCPRLPVC